MEDEPVAVENEEGAALVDENLPTTWYCGSCNAICHVT